MTYKVFEEDEGNDEEEDEEDFEFREAHEPEHAIDGLGQQRWLHGPRLLSTHHYPLLKHDADSSAMFLTLPLRVSLSLRPRCCCLSISSSSPDRFRCLKRPATVTSAGPAAARRSDVEEDLSKESVESTWWNLREEASVWRSVAR